MNEEEYNKAIPPWCYYQTVEQNKEQLMLCWGLVAHIKDKEEIPRDYCKLCEFYRRGIDAT